MERERDTELVPLRRSGWEMALYTMVRRKPGSLLHNQDRPTSRSWASNMVHIMPIRNVQLAR